MPETRNPQVTLTVTRRAEWNKQPVLNEYQGPMEAPMAQEQQDAFKALIGDGKARVTVSREMGESDYGSGGKVFVSVSVECDQSQPFIQAAIEGAKNLAEYFVPLHWAEFREKLVTMGVMKAMGR